MINLKLLTNISILRLHGIARFRQIINQYYESTNQQLSNKSNNENPFCLP